MSESEGGMPLGLTIVALVLFVAAIGWGFAAGLYASGSGMGPSSGGRTSRIGARSRGAFIGNAIQQLDNIPAVTAYTLRHHIWLPILFAVIEVGLVLGYFKMRQIEEHLKNPRRRKRSR